MINQDILGFLVPEELRTIADCEPIKGLRAISCEHLFFLLGEKKKKKEFSGTSLYNSLRCE